MVRVLWPRAQAAFFGAQVFADCKAQGNGSLKAMLPQLCLLVLHDVMQRLVSQGAKRERERETIFPGCFEIRVWGSLLETICLFFPFPSCPPKMRKKTEAMYDVTRTLNGDATVPKRVSLYLRFGCRVFIGRICARKRIGPHHNSYYPFSSRIVGGGPT